MRFNFTNLICENLCHLRCLRAFESNYKNLAYEKAQSDCTKTLFVRQFRKNRNENTQSGNALKEFK